MNIQNIKKEKITDQVFNTMKSMILDGTWPVGEKIPSEAALAAQFGVSKMSVHAALQKMEALGLVDIRVGSGTYVKTNSLADCFAKLSQAVFTDHNVQQVAELRRAIELEAVYLAIDRRTEEQLEELRACYQQFLYAVRTGDMEEIKATDLAFHRYVIRMAGNDLFEVLYDFCYSLLEPFFIASGKIGEALPGRENIVMSSGCAIRTIRCWKRSKRGAGQRRNRHTRPCSPFRGCSDRLRDIMSS